MRKKRGEGRKDGGDGGGWGCRNGVRDRSFQTESKSETQSFDPVSRQKQIRKRYTSTSGSFLMPLRSTGGGLLIRFDEMYFHLSDPLLCT